MAWRLREEEKIKYFEFEDSNVLALYTTKDSGEEIIARLKPIFLKQIHSEMIINIDEDKEFVGDGIITGQKHCAIGVKVADCLPVYMFSPKRIGILHCGWRSINKGIARRAKQLMDDYQYILGASIGPCCYETQPDVAQMFEGVYQNAVVVRDDKYFLDLKRAVTQDLGEARLLGALDFCTRCHPEYFYSFRRGDDQKRNYAILSIR